MKNRTYLPTIAVLAIGVGLAGAAHAHHGKGSHANGGFAGIFEAPLVDDAGALVDGSEAKFNEAGRWKLESSGFIEGDELQICLSSVDGIVHVANVTADEDGEIKSGDDVTGVPLAGGNYQAPSFQVYMGTADICEDGTLVQESGLTVN